MNIVIAGGRDFNNSKIIYNCLDQCNIREGDIILSGHASGVDTIGEQYAAEHNLQLRLFPAAWKKLGRAAGPIRNEEMAKIADRVIAFWDGESRGTKSMIALAKKYSCFLTVFDYSGQIMDITDKLIQKSKER